MVRYTFRLLSLAALSLAPASAFAGEGGFDLSAAPAPEKVEVPTFLNSVELGLGVLGGPGESAFYGRYRGLTDKGAFAIGNFSLRGGDAWDSGGTRFWSLEGTNIGLDSRRITGTYGAQGSWSLGAFFDEIPSAETTHAFTPFTGYESGSAVLPANWVASPSIRGLTSLGADLHAVDLSTDRKKLGGNFVYYPTPGYALRAGFSHEHKSGLKNQSLAFGGDGFNTSALFVPEPVDYDTNQVDASVSYADATLQWQFAYSGSLFTDNLAALSVQNPFSAAFTAIDPWRGKGVGYPAGFAQYSLPPSNSAHQISASMGYSITPRTRISSTATFGLAFQDDPFLPYSPNPQLTVTTPLPRTSLKGKEKDLFATMSLVSRPMDDLDLNAAVTYDDRANKTPQSLYQYIPGDALNQGAPGSIYARVNLPYSFRREQAKAEAGYRFLPKTKIDFGYTYDEIKRTYEEVANNTEHTGRVKLSTGVDETSGWISYDYGVRRGSDYIDNIQQLYSHSQSYLSAASGNIYQNLRTLRMYSMADRDRSQVKIGASRSLTETLLLSLAGGWGDDDYKNSPYGLRHARTQSIDADLTYALATEISTTLFYSFDKIRSDQNEYFVPGNVLTAPNATNPAQNWSAANLDRIHTLGLAADWTIPDSPVSVGISYTLSLAKTAIRQTTHVFSAQTLLAPLPAIDALTHSVGAHLTYRLRDDADLRLGYSFEKYSSNDWSVANLGPTTLQQLLASGKSVPQYDLHLIQVSALYKF